MPKVIISILESNLVDLVKFGWKVDMTQKKKFMKEVACELYEG